MNHETFYKINAWIDALKHKDHAIPRDELALDPLDIAPTVKTWQKPEETNGDQSTAI